MNGKRRGFLKAAAFLSAFLALPSRASDRMKIGIIGAGRVGGTLGTVWATTGHEVMFYSRTLEDDKALAAKVGRGARAGTPREAAAFGEVLLVSVPYRALPEVGKDLGELIRGKVVSDTVKRKLAGA